MFDVGGGELILILLVVLLLFGPQKLPELARAVGKGMRYIRKAQEDLTQQIRDISADVAEPVRDITKDLKEGFNVNLEPDAVHRGQRVLPEAEITPVSEENPVPEEASKPDDADIAQGAGNDVH